MKLRADRPEEVIDVAVRALDHYTIRKEQKMPKKKKKKKGSWTCPVKPFKLPLNLKLVDALIVSSLAQRDALSITYRSFSSFF